MEDINNKKITEAVRKSSSAGLTASIIILFCNLIVSIAGYGILSDYIYFVSSVLVVLSFIFLTICYNMQRRNITDEKTKKSIGYVVFGCILGSVADTSYLLNDILYTLGVRDNSGIASVLLQICSILLIIAFAILAYYFIFLRLQRIYSGSLNTIILLVSLSYVIRTAFNLYSLINSILEYLNVVKQGALMLPTAFMDIIYIIVSIPMVLFFIKVKK